MSPISSHGSKTRMQWLGIYLLVMAIVLTFLIFKLWPTVALDDNGKQVWERHVTFLETKFSIGNEARLILLVMLAGALGSYVHAATSFVDYTGNRSFVLSWTWWYILRLFIGMSLALIFYCAIRGGLLLVSSGGSVDEISPFGMVAVAGLVGLFSKQATDKLREVFDNLFRTEGGKGDDARRDKLAEGLPVGEAMKPFNKITGYTIAEGKTEKDIGIMEIYELFKATVTRIPVFDHKGAAKYIIHQGSLYKFIAEKSIAAGKKAGGFDAKALTLDDFLKHPGIRKLVADSLVFVPPSETLADAKLKMEKTEHCKDIFVTENGRSDEPVKGWLTNTEIAKHIKS